MKISAVIVSRNDNYGGQLNERATYCFNSAIDTYDEVIYVDWNSPTHSLLYDIKDNIHFKGNILSLDGVRKVEVEMSFQMDDYLLAGKKAATELLARGGDKIALELKKYMTSQNPVHE